VKHPSVERLAEWLGITRVPWDQLEAYARWLATEGAAAGAIGPAEVERLWERHLADSLSFAAGFPEPPRSLWDLGSGAGLPGIPLALTFPDTQVTLLDRSGRRSSLLRRAVRVLNLPNVAVQQGDLEDVREAEAVTMRAVLPPDRAAPVVQGRLSPGGVGVIGLARRREPDPRWLDLGGEVVEVSVLDPPGWLLIMRNRGTTTTSGDGGGHQSKGRGR